MFAPFTAEEAAEASSTLLDLAGMVANRLDPACLAPREAMAQLKVISRARKVLAGVEIALSARVADSEQWKDQGDRSAAERIAKETGKSKRQAEDDLRTAKAAEDNPQLADALREGKVSPEQAKEIGAAGAADPDATGDLLDLVDKGASLGEVKDEAEKRRREAEGEDHKARNRARAKTDRFRRTWSKDEMFFLLLGTTMDDGARILAHLGIEDDHVFKRDRAEGTPSTHRQRGADAMTNLLTGTTAAPDDDGFEDDEHEGTVVGHPARSAAGDTTARDDAEGTQGGLFDRPPAETGGPATTDARHHPHDAPGLAESADAPGDQGRAPAPDSVPPPTSARPRSRSRSRSGPPLKGTPSGRLIARLDVAHLWGQPGEATCEIAGVGTVSLAAMAAALPEPWVQLVITRGKDIVNVTNVGRGADLWQQAALDWTVPRCTDIGCNRTLGIQNDHRTPWAEEQITELPNLDPLCPRSHYLKTHHGWALEAGTGRRRLLPPTDPDHPNNRTDLAAATA